MFRRASWGTPLRRSGSRATLFPGGCLQMCLPSRLVPAATLGGRCSQVRKQARDNRSWAQGPTASRFTAQGLTHESRVQAKGTTPGFPGAEWGGGSLEGNRDRTVVLGWWGDWRWGQRHRFSGTNIGLGICLAVPGVGTASFHCKEMLVFIPGSCTKLKRLEFPGQPEYLHHS